MKSYRQLMDMAEPVSLRAGDVLIKQGELGDSAYVLIKGDFEVQKQSGQSLIKIDVRNPGDVVGEMALAFPHATLRLSDRKNRWRDAAHPAGSL